MERWKLKLALPRSSSHHQHEDRVLRRFLLSTRVRTMKTHQFNFVYLEVHISIHQI